jgi:hypothetical protein
MDRQVVNLTSRPLCPVRGWVAPQSGLDTLERRNISYPFREMNHDSPVFQSVVYSLCRLSGSGSTPYLIRSHVTKLCMRREYNVLKWYEYWQTKKTGNAIYRNTEARSRNHCCRGKAIRITYSECVCSLSYPACKTHAQYYIVILVILLTGGLLTVPVNIYTFPACTLVKIIARRPNQAINISDDAGSILYSY